jgi:hypothetical protein
VKKEETKMRSRWNIAVALCGTVLLFGGSVYAFDLCGQDWTYQPNPMGEDWRVCTTGMPAGASSRTKDGGNKWDYSRFNFTFGTDACLSGGVYPTYNGVNQVDFGGGLGAGVLAETTWYYFVATGDIVECDMRFSDAWNWYTGTGTPGGTQFDWWSVAAHEMGHCLCLDHEDGVVPTPVMGSAIGAGEVRRNLTADDRAGRNAIYGVCGILAFVGNDGSPVASLPAAVWLAFPILFVAGWKFSLKRKKGKG